MKFFKTILILSCFHLHGISLFPQYDSLIFKIVSNPLLKDYNLRKICADKTGKLWFATDKGVISYDGNDITLFKHEEGDSTTLNVSSSGRLYLDDSNNLYVFTIPGQEYLNTVTGKVTHLYIQLREEDKSKISFPYAFSQPFIDDDVSIWMGMYNVGFIHYSRKTKQTTYYTSANNLSFRASSVYAIEGDMRNKNVLWLATNDGIYSFNKIDKTTNRLFRCSNPKDSTGFDKEIIGIDEAIDTIWFITPNSGMGCYDKRTGIYTMFPYRDKKGGLHKHLNIIFFQRKNADEYYVSEDDKLPGTFNTKTHKYYFTAEVNDKLPAIQLRHFITDSSKNVWSLIFYQLYLAKHTANQLKTFKLPPSKAVNNLENVFKTAIWDSRNKCYYVAFDTRNEVFVLDTNMQLVRTLPIEQKYHVINNELARSIQIGTGTSQKIISNAEKEINAFDMALDEDGRLWLCGSSLWVYDISSKKIVVPKVNPAINFKQLRFQNFIFRKANIYLQPSNPSSKAIYVINSKQLNCDSILLPAAVLKDTSGRNQADKIIDIIQVDKKEEFAYFCYNRTVFQFNLLTKTARKIITETEQEKPFQHFFNMCWYLLDDMNNLWVASLSGIKIYETKNLNLIKQIPFEKDVYPIQLCNINDQGVVCVLNSAGVLLIDYIHNRQYKFGLSDGLISVFNSGITCVNNQLFIGAVDYLHTIALSTIINNRPARKCYLSRIQIFDQAMKTDSLPAFLHSLTLKHNQNFITLTFSSTEYDQPERLEYRYKMEGINRTWVYANYLDRAIHYNNLKPGNYFFYADVKNADGQWSADGVRLSITIQPAWWQTGVFTFLIAITIISAVTLFVQWRITSVRKQEQLKAKYQKELLELEAKALRAQMNPHFVFNCMNSIKSLIQKNENEKAILYLTTFSKLIRIVFQNSDKRDISLHDELETCRLYVQLESMRFGDKFSYAFNINENIDLKSVMVPALIIQPFIENAIWHGIMLKSGSGMLTVTIDATDHIICCIIDDDGIGREVARQNSFKSQSSIHESKGVRLTQARLNLDNLLNEKKAKLKIIDKLDENNIPCGTTVVLNFNEY